MPSHSADLSTATASTCSARNVYMHSRPGGPQVRPQKFRGDLTARAGRRDIGSRPAQYRAQSHDIDDIYDPYDKPLHQPHVQQTHIVTAAMVKPRRLHGLKRPVSYTLPT